MSHSSLLSSAAVAVLVLFGGTAATADFVINDDLIVQGSICAGFDCVNGENFDFDTLRLKENNTRIQFNDTSGGSFPTNNWQIRANSSSSGGPNFLAIVDQGATGVSETGTIVFSVAANAGANALVVNAGGNVGFGNASPVVKLHATNGNTPTLRLEQNGTSGFTPQTWDLAGNETNFFLRDATNGSRLPFRVQPNAPTNSIFVAAPSGDVGLGTSAPANSLHVRRTDGSATLFIEEANGTASNTRIQLKLQNKGSAQIALVDTNPGTATDWRLQNLNDKFRVTKAGTGVAELELDNLGNLVIQGSLTQLSDKHAKMAILPVDVDQILDRVIALPVSSWSYKGEAKAGIRHIGPMAQDFYAAFGTGHTDTGISTLDSSGVALAAIQALAAQNARLAAEIAVLKTQVAAR